MKKLSLFLAALMVSVMSFADVLYTLDTTGDLKGSNNGYATNCDVEVDGITWNITGNATMNPWRVGGKNLEGVEREVYTKTAFSQAVGSIVLTLGTANATLDNVLLYYSANEDFSEAVAVEAQEEIGVEKDLTFTVEGGFPANSYYKFVFTVTNTLGSNKYIQLSKIVFNGEATADFVVVPEINAEEETFLGSTEVTITAGEGTEIYYTLDGTDPTTESIKYEGAFTISETTTVKAIAVKGENKSAVTSKTFNAIPVFDSLEDLAQADLQAGTAIQVTFANAQIESLQITKAGIRAGIYFDILKDEKKIEIYFAGEEVPAEWVEGGKVSGTINATWTQYNGTWEIVPATGWSWSELTYEAPSTTALPEVNADQKARKVVENGVIYIIRNGVRYNALGGIAE